MVNCNDRSNREINKSEKDWTREEAVIKSNGHQNEEKKRERSGGGDGDGEAEGCR